MSSRPVRIRMASVGTRPVALPGPPEIALHVVQWHSETRENGSVTSKVTPPQRQLPRTLRLRPLAEHPAMAFELHLRVRDDAVVVGVALPGVAEAERRFEPVDRGARVLVGDHRSD